MVYFLLALAVVVASVLLASTAISYELEEHGLYLDEEAHLHQKTEKGAEDEEDQYCLKDAICSVVRADCDRVPAWLNDGATQVQLLPERQIICKTSTRELVAKGDDYLVKADNGEIFVMKKDDFEKFFVKICIEEGK